MKTEALVTRSCLSLHPTYRMTGKYSNTLNQGSANTGLPCLTLYLNYILPAKQGSPFPFYYLIIWIEQSGWHCYSSLLAWAYQFGMIVHTCQCDKTLGQAWNRHAWMMCCYNRFCTQNIAIMTVCTTRWARVAAFVSGAAYAAGNAPTPLERGGHQSASNLSCSTTKCVE